MTINSIEEIQKFFGIKTDEIAEIRKYLKSYVAELHPDKTGGEFATKKQENDYIEYKNALVFIDELEQQVIVSKKDWALVLQKLDNLSLVRQTSEAISENHYSEQLNNSINTSIISFHKKHSFLKISSLAITSILTIFWAFPQIASSHPVLKNLISSDSPIFNSIWLAVIIFTAFSWLYTRNLEGKDDQIKKTYNFEGTQGGIFKLFIAWIVNINSKSRDYNSEDQTYAVYFIKDDLTNFITNYYEYFNQEFQDKLMDTQYNIVEAITKINKENSNILLRKRKQNDSFLRLFFKRAGDIDIELGQKISDTIIGKLLARKIIVISNKKTFSETYRFDYKYL